MRRDLFQNLIFIGVILIHFNSIHLHGQTYEIEQTRLLSVDFDFGSLGKSTSPNLPNIFNTEYNSSTKVHFTIPKSKDLVGYKLEYRHRKPSGSAVGGPAGSNNVQGSSRAGLQGGPAENWKNHPRAGSILSPHSSDTSVQWRDQQTWVDYQEGWRSAGVSRDSARGFVDPDTQNVNDLAHYNKLPLGGRYWVEMFGSYNFSYGVGKSTEEARKAFQPSGSHRHMMWVRVTATFKEDVLSQYPTRSASWFKSLAEREYDSPEEAPFSTSRAINMLRVKLREKVDGSRRTIKYKWTRQPQQIEEEPQQTEEEPRPFRSGGAATGSRASVDFLGYDIYTASPGFISWEAEISEDATNPVVEIPFSVISNPSGAWIDIFWNDILLKHVELAEFEEGLLQYLEVDFGEHLGETGELKFVVDSNKDASTRVFLPTAFDVRNLIQTAEADKDEQEISFSSLPSQSLVDDSFPLNATSTSGLPVTYSSSNPLVATVDGNTVTLLSSGTTEITAYQEGDDLFLAAPPIAQTLKVYASISITQQPVAREISAGETIVMSVSTLNADDLTYQWRRNGLAIEGEISSELTLENISSDSQGEYSVVVSNPVESVISDSASLVVNRLNQQITFQELGVKGTDDLSFDLFAESESGLPVSFTNSNREVAIVDEEKVTLIGAGTTIITASQPGNSFYQPAAEVQQVLTVYDPVKIIGLFDDLVSSAKDKIALKVLFEGGGPTHFQWYKEGVAISGEDRDSFFIEEARLEDSGVYSVSVSNPVSRVMSNPFSLSIKGLAQNITFSPIEPKSLGDGSFTLSARSDSGLPVSYSISGSEVAFLDGERVNLVAPGKAIITAQQSGEPFFLPAEDVSQTLHVYEPVEILIQPESKTVNTGDSVALNVSVTGSEPIDYKWYKDGIPMAGFTGARIELDNVSAGNAGIYDAVISNPVSSVKTENAVIAVDRLPQEITFEPFPVMKLLDQPFRLNASSSSGLPVSFKSSNPDVALVVGDLVTLTGSGSTTITAFQQGDDTYLSAVEVTQVLDVKDSGSDGDDPGSGVSIPTGVYNVAFDVEIIRAEGDHPADETVGLKGTEVLEIRLDNEAKTIGVVIEGEVVESKLVTETEGEGQVAGLTFEMALDQETITGTYFPRTGLIAALDEATDPGVVVWAYTGLLPAYPEDNYSGLAPESIVSERLTLTIETSTSDAIELRSQDIYDFQDAKTLLAEDGQLEVAYGYSRLANDVATIDFAVVAEGVLSPGSAELTFTEETAGTYQLINGDLHETGTFMLEALTNEGSGSGGEDPTSKVIPNLDLELVSIAAGTFTMGSPAKVGRFSNEVPQTEVTISKSFWLGKTEVTQGQWESLMEGNPSSFKGPDLPVESVSWEDAMAFCEKLTQREREADRLPEGYVYTLPTEAQWEYACRAGTTTRFSFGDNDSDLGDYGWYNLNSRNSPHPVGEKLENSWGLYDMHGNVWEWCRDWYGNYPGGTITDPAGHDSGSSRILRGGAWGGDAESCRSAYRDANRPVSAYESYGFRLALIPVSSTESGGSGSDVEDLTAPIITLIGEATIQHALGTPYEDPGATAADNVDDTVTVIRIGTVDGNTLGSYTLTYSAGDSAGNAATPVTRTVDVVDLSSGGEDPASKVIPDLDLELVSIVAGTFTMGSPADEVGRFNDEGPQTEVTISKSFWLGKTEVTQGQWESVMGGNPSHFKGPDLPVEQVSWEDAMAFCEVLTQRERDAGRLPEGYVYTLPTEAQWEYACRAGTTTRFSFGDSDSDLGDYGWYGGNSGNQTHPVGEKLANPWGLYDMHGNVNEWCRDWSGNYSGGTITDPAGADSGSLRILRGGFFNDVAGLCRSASRSRSWPLLTLTYVGFRVALVPVSSTESHGENPTEQIIQPPHLSVRLLMDGQLEISWLAGLSNWSLEQKSVLLDQQAWKKVTGNVSPNADTYVRMVVPIGNSMFYRLRRSDQE
jgi:formylglycine-generating enzyme required for sulfatase activity